jgi:hypothetical protein
LEFLCSRMIIAGRRRDDVITDERVVGPRRVGSFIQILEEPGEDEQPVVGTEPGSIAETVTELLQRLAS